MSKFKKSLAIFLVVILSAANLSGCFKQQGKVKTEVMRSDASNMSKTAAPIKATPVPVKSTPAPVKRISTPVVRGVYLNNAFLSNNDKVASVISMSKKTELNSVVIDVKGDEGYLSYKSSVPLVNNIGASTSRINIENILKLFHDNNIYVIGRIVCFRDPVLAKARADLSFRAKDGSLWKDFSGMPWVNPFNRENWKYIIDISKEAADLGFDEIQYDYVRFGNEGNVKNIDFGAGFDPAQKPDAIAEFLNTAYKALAEKKIKVSADVFAISAITNADDKILGQNLEKVAKEVDVISPMVYPSHYSNVKQNNVGQIINNITFQKPDLDPYNVVYQTMSTIKKRTDLYGTKANIRPYLQAFTASYLGKGYYQKYGADQIRQQIKAVYDTGYKEWILWDSSSNYSVSYFQAKK